MTKPTLLFETARLLIRQVDSADVDAMYSVYGDFDAMRWVGDGQPLALERCEEWIVVIERNYALRGYGISAVVEQQSGSVIGFCGLVHPGSQPEPEIKYALTRESWGKGFATEAATAMLAYGAASHGMAKVIATVAPENKSSHRVLEKAGMQLGELRHNEDGSFTQLFVWYSSLDKKAP